MAYSLGNDLELSILFGKAEFPLENTNQLLFLHASENVKLYVPMLVFALIDSQGMLERMGLQDGTLITVNIISKGTVLQAMPFRLYSYRTQQQGEEFFHGTSSFLTDPGSFSHTDVHKRKKVPGTLRSPGPFFPWIHFLP